MNAEQVVEKILSQAKAESQAILSEAKDKAAAAGAQFEKELAAFEAKTDQLARTAGEDRLQRMLAAARMSNARRLLGARIRILDEVFDKARKTINELPDEAYQSLMVSLMVKAVQTGDEEVVIGKGEKRITEALLARVNTQLKTGFKGNLRLSSERADLAGGFILTRGRVRINAGTDVMIDRLRESIEMELAAELFK